MATVKIEKLSDGTNNLLITDDEGSGQYRIPLGDSPSSGSANHLPTGAKKHEYTKLISQFTDGGGASGTLALETLDDADTVVAGTFEILVTLGAAFTALNLRGNSADDPITAETGTDGTARKLVTFTFPESKLGSVGLFLAHATDFGLFSATGKIKITFYTMR